MQSLVLVGLGGAAGALLRWTAGRVHSANSGANAVLALNVVGSAALGSLHGAQRSQGIELSPSLVHLSTTGFCGGLTTFSSFAVGILKLQELGFARRAFAFALANNLLGVSAAYTCSRHFRKL